MEKLWLLLKAGVGEGLLESHTVHEKRVFHGSARHFLDANHVLVQLVVQGQHCVHHHLREERGVLADQFRRHGGGGTPLQKLAELFFVFSADMHFDLVDLGHRQLARLAQALDDQVRRDAVLDEGLALLQKLARQNRHRCGSVAHFGILRPRNVHKHLGGRVHNVQELENRGAVVGNGGFAAGRLDQDVRSKWAERGL